VTSARLIVLAATLPRGTLPVRVSRLILVDRFDVRRRARSPNMIATRRRVVVANAPAS